MRKQLLTLCLFLSIFMTGCRERKFDQNIEQNFFVGHLIIKIQQKGVDKFTGVKDGIFHVEIETLDSKSYRVEFWYYAHRSNDKLVKEITIEKEGVINFDIPVREGGDIVYWNPVHKVRVFSSIRGKLVEGTWEIPRIYQFEGWRQL